MLSPLVEDDPIGQLSPLVKDDPIARLSPIAKEAPFGQLSPLARKRDPFPLSPPSKPTLMKKVEKDPPWLAAFANDASEGEGNALAPAPAKKDKGKARELEPFPMATQVLESIGEVERLKQEGVRPAAKADKFRLSKASRPL